MSTLEQEVTNPIYRPTEKTGQGVAQSTRVAPSQTPPYSTPTEARADTTPAPRKIEPPHVAAVTGSWGRNPFLTPEEIDFLRNPRKYDVEPEPPAVRLSTILTVNGKRTAAINGHYLSVGDLLGSERIVKITAYSLILERQNGKTREVKLHEPIVEVRRR
jgi:hypothetical protein